MTATAAETDRITELATLAQKAIDQHEIAVKNLRDVSTTLAQLESLRAMSKTAAIVRLCQIDNPATPGKKYSASQAADFALLDNGYAEYKDDVTKYTLLKQEAEGNVATARLVAQMAIALFRAEAGLE